MSTIPLRVADAPRRHARGLRYVAYALIGLMAGLHLAAGYGTSGVPDLYRDLYWAQAILDGDALPLRGPVIYNTIELGPWWYYFVALALAVTGSLAGSAALVALVAAAKYALAWRLGTRIGDDALGLCAVVALVVPGWSAAPLGFPTHTALVEAALLGLALATLACRVRFTVARALGFGLLAAGCLHAHPTTAALVVLAAVAVLAAQRTPRAWSLMALAALVGIASLLPPLLARDDAAADFAGAIVRYAGADVGVDPVLRTGKLAASIALGGGWHGMMLLTTIGGGQWIAVVVQALAISIALAGAWLGWRRGGATARWAGLAIAIFIGQAAFLALLRPVTPIWMTSTLVPPFAFALACGWRSFSRAAPATRAIAAVAMLAYLGVGLSIFGFFVREIDTLRIGRSGNVFMDAGMSWSTAYDEARIARLRLRRIERATNGVCGRTTLHGDLAIADETALGLPSRRACGENEIRYGGRSDTHDHVAGYLLGSWCAIGLRPGAVGSGFGFSRAVTALAPEEGSRRPELGPRQIDAIPAPLVAAPMTLSARAPAGAIVALTKRYNWLNELALDAVEADGRPAKLVHEDLSTRFYRCDGCRGDDVRWELRGRGNLAGIDLVALADDPAGTPACATTP